MFKQMLINVTDPEESRVAILEDAVLEELYVEKAEVSEHVGDIFKGKVASVLPSIQAAFVDFGGKRNGFLHISDMISRGRRRGEGGRNLRIEKMVRRGEELVVQIAKEGIGNKGSSLTEWISLAGRFLVLMPYVRKHGVSRKITDEAKRKQLLEMLKSLKPPRDLGFIIRTAGMDQTKKDLERDLKYLLRLWKVVERRIRKTSAPGDVYRESDLVIRTIRDIYSLDIDEIIVDSESVYRRVEDFVKAVMPRQKVALKLYSERGPLFHRFKIESEIDKINQRLVKLPSGVELVFEQTEALVAIDVNSGSFRKGKDPERAAFQINMEAAREVTRQIRLRDLGGIIIVDFIDMEREDHIRQVERAFNEAMKRDRAKSHILRMSKFGIIQMTRQRLRPSLKRVLYVDCPYCGGTGLLKSVETMGIGVLRQTQSLLANDQVAQVDVTVNPEVEFYLLNSKRKELINLEKSFSKKVTVRGGRDFGVEEVKFSCYNSENVPISLEASGRVRK